MTENQLFINLPCFFENPLYYKIGLIGESFHCKIALDFFKRSAYTKIIVIFESGYFLIREGIF